MGDQGHAHNHLIYPTMVQKNDVYTVIDVMPLKVKQPNEKKCHFSISEYNARISEK